MADFSADHLNKTKSKKPKKGEFMKHVISLAMATVVLFSVFISSTSCHKEVTKWQTVVDSVAVPGPKSLLAVVKSPDLQEGQTVTPGNGAQFAQYIIANNSNQDSVTVNFVNLRVMTSPGNVLSGLNVSTQGAYIGIDKINQNNVFPFNIVLGPNEQRTVFISVQTDKKDTGYMTTALQTIATWKDKKDTIDYVAGQTVRFLVPEITDVSVYFDNSSYSQYIPSSSGAGNSWQVTYKFKTTGNGNGQFNIEQLGLSVAGANTATTVQINNGTYSFTNGILAITDLNYYTWGRDIYLTAKVSTPPVGVGAVPSGSPSQIILTYVKYNNGTADKELNLSVKSSAMTLTASIPHILAYSPYSKLKHGWVEVLDVYATADAQGSVAINSIPIQTFLQDISLGAGANVQVQDAAGNLINATITSFSSDKVAVIRFTDPGGYKIAAGSTAQFKIFFYFQDEVINDDASVGTTVVDSNDFAWTDIAGGSTIPFLGGSRIPLYPAYQYAYIRK